MERLYQLTPQQRRRHQCTIGVSIALALSAWAWYQFVPAGWGAAAFGGIFGAAMFSAGVLVWHPRLARKAEDPRILWRYSTLMSWLAFAVMAFCLIVALLPGIPYSVSWLAVLGVLVSGFVGGVLGYPATMLPSKAGPSTFKDELWAVNTHRAGYWACVVVGAFAAGLVGLLALKVFALSGLYVALLIMIAVPLTYSVSLVWLEWRSGD
ncbi:MAG: hypothetical protein AAF557_10375 [Pseudomonadota bacterium]